MTVQLTEDAYFDRWAKEEIISRLANEGYGSYAKRFMSIEFHVADFGTCGGKRFHIDTACMIDSENKIYINPAFFDEQKLKEKTWPQLSVLVRHELLHFLLDHANRFSEYLQTKYPDDWTLKMASSSVKDLSNMADDWELSEIGYSKDDIKVVKAMQRGSTVIGGLVLELDHSEWLGLTTEEIFEKLYEEKQKIKDANPTLHIKKATHSDAYRKIYNEIMKKYDKDSVSDAELADLFAKASNGEDIR